MPGNGADALAQLKDAFEMGQIVAGDCGIDLKFHTGLLVIPRKEASKAPGTPRKASWLAASGPSMEMEQRETPASWIFAAVSGVIRVPLGEKAQVNP